MKVTIDPMYKVVADEFNEIKKKMNATCTYCGSKKHITERCLLGRTKQSNKEAMSMDTWKYISDSEVCNHDLPTITIKELSYLLSLARKKLQNNVKGYGIAHPKTLVNDCFSEIRKQLNLRKRARQ